MAHESVPRNQILDESADGISRRAKLTGLTPAEARVRAEETYSRRIQTVKSKVPDRIMRMIENTPVTYRGRLVKALSGECSPAKAVIAMCEHCVGYEEVRPRVGGCTSFGCPLHHFRPYQEKPL